MVRLRAEATVVRVGLPVDFGQIQNAQVGARIAGGWGSAQHEAVALRVVCGADFGAEGIVGVGGSGFAGHNRVDRDRIDALGRREPGGIGGERDGGEAVFPGKREGEGIGNGPGGVEEERGCQDKGGLGIAGS